MGRYDGIRARKIRANSWAFGLGASLVGPEDIAKYCQRLETVVESDSRVAVSVQCQHLPMPDSLLEKLNLPSALSQRVLCRVAPSENFLNGTDAKPFVLYLPTVVLRKRHNPGFALACRIANLFGLPVLVLCTVLDDQHLTRNPHKPVCMTARRLAFTLEALQSCTREWQDHGAGVAVRVHGPSSRLPHHLTLAHNALAVVSDEPFVEPFRTYIRKVVGTCQRANVPCYTVDGSTTVPPRSRLRPSPNQSVTGDITFQGAPAKSWIWEKQTNPYRKHQVYGAVKDGFLDAPDIATKLPPGFFLEEQPSSCTKNVLPSSWNHVETLSPGNRPWTVEELLAIPNIKEWVMKSWPGADISVHPCRQTHGSYAAAQQRWQGFLNQGLSHYAKRRNQILLPHAVSRISCYLNLGILSIFDVVADVWEARSTRPGFSAGCLKFLEEVIKWREIGYVHTFALPGYHTADAIPKWSQDFFRKQHQQRITEGGYSYEELEAGATNDETWNAMQNYLVETGELHNNARMTWGKTVVHWQAATTLLENFLWQLCCLNDRYALDGLSPPSYAGILWCFGWCDKPGAGGSVTTKWAHKYRQGPGGFEQAKSALHDGVPAATLNATSDRVLLSAPTTKKSLQEPSHPMQETDPPSKSTPDSIPSKRARRDNESGANSRKDGSTGDSTRSILEYFAPVRKR